MYTKLAVTGRRMLTSTEHPNRLIMWQKHEFTIRFTGSKKVRLLFLSEALDSLESVHLSLFLC